MRRKGMNTFNGENASLSKCELDINLVTPAYQWSAYLRW